MSIKIHIGFLTVLLLIAVSGSATFADPEEKSITVEAAVRSSVPASYKVPDRWALVIGVGAFTDNRIPKLLACANDAKAIGAALTDPSIGMFPPDHVTVLTDEQVTREAVVDGLVQLRKKAGRDDLVIVFFSGHGATDEEGEAYWIMCNTQVDKLRATAVPETDITDLLGRIKTTRMVTLIDACYSAATANLGQSKSLLDLAKIYPEFKGDGRVLMTASKGDQLSVVINSDGPGKGYSAFAWNLNQGLRGAADTDGDGIITVDKLWNYVKDRTEDMARREGGNQEPQIKGQFGSKFLLAVNAPRLLGRATEAEAASALVRKRVTVLKKFFDEDKINAAQVEEGRRVIESSEDRLDATDRERRKIYFDLTDGRLGPEYLQAATDRVETPEQRAAKVTKNEAAKAETARLAFDQAKQTEQEQQRQMKIKDLLATAKANDDEEHDTVALEVLDELLKIDPGNVEGQQLRVKIAQYAGKKNERLMQAFRVKQTKIASLMLAIQANDNEASGKTALEDLAKVLQLDPGNAEAVALIQKINRYYSLDPVTFPLDAAKAGELQKAWAKSEGREVVTTNSLGMKLVFIPKGEFLMGSPLGEEGRSPDEVQHKVKLTRSFAMGSMPVTQGQWKALMGNNPSHFDGENLFSHTNKDDYPVDQVSWDDAQAFCLKLSQKEGKHYRLPTEAEWEYACRAGSAGAYGGSGILNEMGWSNENSACETHQVGLKGGNAWDLFDMHGNVAQWCGDVYCLYPGGEATDPKVNEGSVFLRVLRGGSWGFVPGRCRSASRCGFAPDGRYGNFGFRLVLDY